MKKTLKKLFSFYLVTILLCIACLGVGVSAEPTNILGNATISVLSMHTQVSTLAPGNMIDGSVTSRYAASSAATPLVLQLKLDAIYKIDKVSFYERFQGYTMGDDIKIELGKLKAGSASYGEAALTGGVLNQGANPGNTAQAPTVQTDFALSNNNVGDVIQITITNAWVDKDGNPTNGVKNSTTNPTGKETQAGYSFFEIEAYGEKVSDSYTNFLKGKTVTTSIAAKSTTLSNSKITDGNTVASSSRFETNNTTTKSLTAEIDLGGVYSIEWVTLMTRYLNATGTCASYFKVETGLTDFRGTDWNEVNTNFAIEKGSAGDGGTTVTNAVFDSVIKADKLRITLMRNADDDVSRAYSIAEIEAYGTYTPNESSIENVLVGKHVETNIKAINHNLEEKDMVDGSRDWASSRYAPVLNDDNLCLSPLVVTVRLDGTYSLLGFKIFERIGTTSTPVTSSDKTDIYVGTTTDGLTEWTKVVDGESLTPGNAGAVIENIFALDNEENADAVRIVMDRANKDYLMPYNIVEIEAYGEKVSNEYSYVETVVYSQNGETVDYAPATGEFDVKVSYSDGFVGTSIISLYDDNNALLACKIAEPDAYVSFNVGENIVGQMKILSWDTIEGLSPLMDVYRQWVYER